MTTLESTRELSPATRPWRRTVRAYVALTKPRIIELLLVTTVPVMFLAQRGVPSLSLILLTLVGGSLSAGAANTFNMVYDRDIDAQMGRTQNRPLVTGEASARGALIFAFVLTALATAWLWLLVNPLSAMLSLAAIVLYAVLYTMILKRRTSQNIVWGGIAGCMPTLIGWSAVTNSVEWPAIILFLVIFFWTPPHYWPLSIGFADDYAAAGVPMLPVVRQMTTVARQIVAYSWVMVLTSLVLIPVADMGWIYVVAAVASGALFVAEAHRLLAVAKTGETKQSVLKPMRLFHFSITYVTLLFLGVAIDPLLHLPLPGLA
ncbi:protoheme IX farnesyltransferase [Janibacter sp. Soil728]|uniref:heme o synthase n=1 Tax=Janibacter sp. Soil728 TaxID=1736393 RepID=UPI0006F68B9C|nr:heme o synthase [Janibacter sp. Soil728]KRE37124.1 protoheme IX farnesyltransferase [Janibacter sp. Soil728]